MLVGALEEKNDIILGQLLQGEHLATDMAADTTVHLQDGSKVRTHSVVLAAGSQYFRDIAQVALNIKIRIHSGISNSIYLHTIFLKIINITKCKYV